MTTKGDPIQEVLKAHLERGPASENPDFQLAFCPAFDLHLLFRDRSRSSLPVVNGLYAGILNRLPDESGLELWSAYLDAGSSASWMGFELLASAEGRRQAPGIRASAMNVLRRGEVLERLPILREAGVLTFLSSPVRLEVVAAFLVTLGRCPNEAELIAVTDQIHGGSALRTCSSAWRTPRRRSGAACGGFQAGFDAPCCVRRCSLSGRRELPSSALTWSWWPPTLVHSIFEWTESPCLRCAVKRHQSTTFRPCGWQVGGRDPSFERRTLGKGVRVCE